MATRGASAGERSSPAPGAASGSEAGGGDNESATSLLQEKRSRGRERLADVSLTEYMTVGILCFVNLINYMDRFTLAGILVDVKSDFGVQDDMVGLLQTVFVLSYMVFAPIFGYLGDRHSRRYIMVAGVALWSVTTMLGSFMKDFGWFMLFRCLVGIGEASYSTIAPTIISDLFVGNIRSKMLALFYFAIPVGSGLGYIVGSETAAAAGDWRWGLRVTPFLGAIAVGLICWVMAEPERGQAEESHIQPTSYSSDVKSLVQNPSFMLSTLAFTCVAFVTGALAWWGPEFIYLGLKLQPGMQDVTKSNVAFKFGIVAMMAGLIGVPLGSFLAQRLRFYYQTCDPLICGFGLIVSSPLIFFALLTADSHVGLCYFLVFLGEVALNMSWSIIADILLYVVIPPRRSTAEAFQILISHMFGDAGSPYLVGVLSEALKVSMSHSTPESPVVPSDLVVFKARQYALFVTCFVEVIGGVFFLLTAVYIVRDKMLVDKAISEAEAQAAEPSHRYAQDAIAPAE